MDAESELPQGEIEKWRPVLDNDEATVLGAAPRDVRSAALID